jgi:hypothetical protein
LDVDEVGAEYLLPAITVIGIQPTSHYFCVCPQRIFPTTYQAKLVFHRVIKESKVPIIYITKETDSGVIILIVKVALGICKDGGERTSILLTSNFVYIELVPLVLH